MFQSLNTCIFTVPMPIFLIGTYNINRQANICSTTYGGICAVQPPCFSISISRNQCTHSDIVERKDFTVNIPSTDMINRIDYARHYKPSSTNLVSDLDFQITAGEHVDAPFFSECPAVIELICTHVIELGSHTNFIAEIMDVKVKQYCLDENNTPIIKNIDPIIYVPLAREYWNMGHLIARAFSTGTKIFKDATIHN